MSDSLVTDNADYTRLRDLLASGQWRDADAETKILVLGIVQCRRECEGLAQKDAAWLANLSYLREDDVHQLPQADLDMIDGLWMGYSNSRFGFVIQARIWDEVGQDYAKFADAVDWRRGYADGWRSYSQLIFTLDAPPGHLPAGLFFAANGSAVGWTPTLVQKVQQFGQINI
jgi:GUN4-like